MRHPYNRTANKGHCSQGFGRIVRTPSCRRNRSIAKQMGSLARWRHRPHLHRAPHLRHLPHLSPVYPAQTQAEPSHLMIWSVVQVLRRNASCIALRLVIQLISINHLAIYVRLRHSLLARRPSQPEHKPTASSNRIISTLLRTHQIGHNPQRDCEGDGCP